MNKFAALGILAGIGLIILGIFQRHPGQTAISSAIIATGVMLLVIVAVLSLLVRAKDRNGRG